MERDEPEPKDGEFWMEDDGRGEMTFYSDSLVFLLEPIPSSMDNWGEGVVPACREEQPKMFVRYRLII